MPFLNHTQTNNYEMSSFNPQSIFQTQKIQKNWKNALFTGVFAVKASLTFKRYNFDYIKL
jgi:hypothetical protein